MQIIIKGRRSIELADDLKKYIDDKVRPVVEKNLKEPTVVEVVLMDNNGSKGGVDKEIHITATLPHVKGPVHVEGAAEDFYKTIDLIVPKFSRALHSARR